MGSQGCGDNCARPPPAALAVLADDILTVELSAQPPVNASPVLLVAGTEFPDAELMQIDHRSLSA